MARKATEQVTTIGIDIGKNTFHPIGLDGAAFGKGRDFAARFGTIGVVDGSAVSRPLPSGKRTSRRHSPNVRK